MMLRTLALLSGPVLLAGVVAAADLPDIRARGTLRVLAGEGEQPEMFSLKPGGKPGFERELIDGFAGLHRLKVAVIPVKKRDDRLPALLRGDGDVLIGLVDTEARRKRIDFTHEVLPAQHVVVTRRPHPVVATIEQLRAERVGIVEGASWAEAVKDAGVPASRTESFADLAGTVDALRAGKVTATLMSISNFVLVARRDPALQAGTFFGAPGHTAWGIRKEDTQLHRALDDYLDNVRKTPSWSRLVVEYFGERALEVLGRAKKQ
jgi:ABC-type amino acid transport substrate-binding protein